MLENSGPGDLPAGHMALPDDASTEDKADLDLIRIRLAVSGTAALNAAADSGTAVAEGTVPST